MSPAIIRLALRSLLGRVRVLVLVAMAGALLGLALLIRLAPTGPLDPTGGPLDLVRTFGIGVVVPVVTLIGTTTLITSEIDDGSIIYLLSKPIPRWVIVASKMLVILASSVLFAVVPMALAALIMVGVDGGLWWSALLGGTVSAIAYTGAFALLALVARRSVTGCLVYWLVWEALLTNVLSPAQYVSARAYGTSLVHAATGVDAHPATWFAAVASVVALAAGSLLAGWRLTRVTISQD
jgi:ABC-2 type transport system permease protein